MRVSTKGRYGLRAMIELGINFGSGPVTMNVIADRQEISLKYLHALLASLRSAGLIRSVRGSKGGYTLTRMPDNIYVDEILEALEGAMHPVECVLAPDVCRRSGSCAARNVWTGLHKTMVNYLRGISLDELVAWEKATIQAHAKVML